MSGNPHDNTVGSENPSAFAQQPATPPAYTMPAPPQQVSCPRCFTLVAIGTRYCPNCGNAIPPPAPWPTIPAPAPEPRRNTALIIIAVALIAVLVIGVGGFLVYQSEQQQVLQAAKNSEASAANQAPNQLQFTCFSTRNDTSYLSNTGYGFSGYLTEYETFGISNPTSFAMDVTWTITLDFPSAGWVLDNSQTFHETPNGGVAYPTFAFTITATQLNNTPSNANFTIFSVILEGSYRVTGTYATYTPTTRSTYDSTTSNGNGSLGTGNGLPAC
ncbi:MAG TPA: hypothetical protein VF906_06335 [Candidatus Bathyarchaeia archaeon]